MSEKFNISLEEKILSDVVLQILLITLKNMRTTVLINAKKSQKNYSSLLLMMMDLELRMNKRKRYLDLFIG